MPMRFNGEQPEAIILGEGHSVIMPVKWYTTSRQVKSNIKKKGEYFESAYVGQDSPVYRL